MKVKPTQYTISETEGRGYITLTFLDGEIEEIVSPSENMLEVLIENEDCGQYHSFSLTKSQLEIICKYGNELLSEDNEAKKPIDTYDFNYDYSESCMVKVNSDQIGEFMRYDDIKHLL